MIEKYFYSIHLVVSIYPIYFILFLSKIKIENDKRTIRLKF